MGWLIASGVESTSGPRWLIFLTNWSIVGFNIYLFLAALSVTVKFLSVHVFKTEDSEEFRSTQYNFDKPKGCCGYRSNRLSWYQMIHWASFAIFGDIALAIVILFWTILYRGGPESGVSIHHHLLNGIVIVVDVLFFGVPVSLLHFIYPVLFSSTYSIYTGIYWAANGTNPFNEQRFVYSALDYSETPTVASITVVLVVFFLMPILHLISYALHMACFWLVYAIYGRSNVSNLRKQTVEIENKLEKTNEEKV